MRTHEQSKHEIQLLIHEIENTPLAVNGKGGPFFAGIYAYP